MVKAEVVTSPDGKMTALEIETINNSSGKDDDGSDDSNKSNGNSGKGSDSGSGSDDGSADDKNETPEPGDDNSGDD